MDRIPVKSSNLRSVGYDKDTQTIEIEFIQSDPKLPVRIWQYEGVPQDIKDTMMKAESIGSYFHCYVRPCYEGHRIDSPKEEKREEAKQEAKPKKTRKIS